LGDSLIAPNHEFNLEWGSKSAYDEPKNYAKGYARLVREMMSVSGANFEFCYAPARNRLGVAPEAWPVNTGEWPSDIEPPTVTPTFYDAGRTYPDDLSSLTQEELDQRRDQIWQEKHKPLLDMWRDFATARGASLGFREWGVGDDAYYNPAGGDNAEFINRMFDYMRNNDVRFQAYWNAESAGGGSHRIWPENETTLDASGQAWKTQVLLDVDGTDGSDSEPTPTPTPTPTLGGYVRPEAGTLNWHEPLNQNFADIEADIKSLDERLKKLE
jgi:hypothetical protein